VSAKLGKIDGKNRTSIQGNISGKQKRSTKQTRPEENLGGFKKKKKIAEGTFYTYKDHRVDSKNNENSSKFPQEGFQEKREKLGDLGGRMKSEEAVLILRARVVKINVGEHKISVGEGGEKGVFHP